MKYYLGVDLGGTNIAVGVVDENYRMVGRGNRKTGVPRPAEQIVVSIGEACNEALANANLSLDDIPWVGIGSPGVVDSEKGEIEYANNLLFSNVPLRALMEKELGKPIFLENDANTAAFGEVVAGGAKGYRDVVDMVIGTGVGGGIIIGGKIYSGFNHAGGELGHVGMCYGGQECTCHMLGCIESYCSVTALIRQTKEAMEQSPDSKMWEICGRDLNKVDGRTSFNAMRAGDEAAAKLVAQFCDYLGYAVNSYINMLQPQVVLIGGGICKEGDTLLAPVRQFCQSRSFVKSPEKQTQIRAATLGNDAGIIGAAFLGSL